MKRILSALIFLSITFSVTAEELPDYLQDMKEKYEGRMKVWDIKDDDVEDKNGNDVFVLKFESRQDKRDRDLNYLMRVTVQLTDKRTKAVVYAQTRKKPSSKPSLDWYADHTEWEFQIPFGQLQKPKLTAYVIEFGFMKDSRFVPVAVDCDDVETPEEIMEGGGTKVAMKCTRSRHINYGM